MRSGRQLTVVGEVGDDVGEHPGAAEHAGQQDERGRRRGGRAGEVVEELGQDRSDVQRLRLPVLGSPVDVVGDLERASRQE